MRGRWWVRVMLAAALVAGGGVSEMSAHDPGQDPAAPEKPADAPPATPATPARPAEKKPLPKKNKDNATESAEDQPKWDPQRAEKDIEVGQYYMRKGDVDAAIDRFTDATVAKPGYAVPFKYLGEAQEKKGLKKPAAKSYQRYLDLYPKAEDAEKIRKRIEKLYKEAEKEKKDIR